jgi:hypothetical protein
MTASALNAYLAPSALLPRPICSPQMSATLALTLRLSTQLLNRLALRPVVEFPQPPWMVVTPSTTTAAADSCLFQKKKQVSSNKVRQLSPDPCSVYSRLLWLFMGFTVFCQLTPHLLPRYEVLVHQVQGLSPASFPRSLTLTQLPFSSGSSSQRPQQSFTP